MKQKISVVARVVLLLFSALLYLNRNTIFRCGNPIPYVVKMGGLNNTTPYLKVFDDKEIFITKRDDFSELQKYIESTYNANFHEQIGSGHFSILKPNGLSCHLKFTCDTIQFIAYQSVRKALA